ncbi:hypothetical protein LCGC14_2968890, partial [marine sediment metagenome]
ALRRAMGPDNVVFQFLESLAIQDVCVLIDDDFFELDTGRLLFTNGDANGSLVTDAQTGEVTFNCGADEDGQLVCAANTQRVDVDYRPVILTRMKHDVISNVKTEVGFCVETDVDDGAVNVKVTPSSNSTDYAVLCRDSDDTASGGDTGTFAFHSDNQSDDADGAQSVEASGTGVTLGTDYITYMITLNEQQEARAWINGQFFNVLRLGVPDGGTLLSPWINVTDRDGAATAQLTIDYLKVWQERVDRTA